MKNRVEVGNAGRSRVRYLLALVLAMLLALGAAVPVFAAEEPAEEDGGTVQPQVVGGTSVPDGKYKFMTALRDITRGNTVREQQFCGGTLIDRNSVLTASHCLETVTPAQLRVTVGITSLKEERQGQTRSVTAIARHPLYTNSTISFRYDAAVLTLDRAVKNIAPVKIPATTSNALETPGRQATVAGWGNTQKQGTDFRQPDRFPPRMREAQVPVVSDAEARRVYDSRYTGRLMLAAGREGKDTCQGDSGGPIFVQNDNRVFQIGITSFGDGCGARGFPGVYAEANSDEIRPFIYRAAGN